MAQLTIEVSDDFQKQFEEMLKETAQKVVDEVTNNPLNSKDYFTKKEAAAYLGISYGTFQNLIRKGLPVIYLGSMNGKQLISKRTLNDFLKTLEK